MSNHRTETQQPRSLARTAADEDRMSVDNENFERLVASVTSARDRELPSPTNNEVRESLRSDAVPKGPRQPEKSSRYSRTYTETSEAKRTRHSPSGSQPLPEQPNNSKSFFSFASIAQVFAGPVPGHEEEAKVSSSGRETEITEASKLHEYATGLEGMLSENRQALEAYRGKIHQMEAERSDIINHFNDLAARNRKLEAELQQKSSLLESRTVELRTAESFLTKYDDIPGDEIVNLVCDLNQQVLGMAAKCDELVKFKKNTGDNKARAESVKKYHSDLSPIIGHTLCKHLETMDNNEDPTIIQLAIQAALLSQAYIFMRHWPISSSRSFSTNLWKLYDMIHESELQAIASRWRALCSKYLREGSQEDARAHKDHVDSTLEIIAKILYCAGANLSVHELIDLGQKKLGEDIDRLWHSVAQLAMKTKESVLSTDYEVIVIPPGTDYDPTVAQCQGSQGQKSKSTSGKVLCTTDLGLRRSTSSPKQGSPIKGGLENVVTLKATVVFEHEIMAMLSLD